MIAVENCVVLVCLALAAQIKQHLLNTNVDANDWLWLSAIAHDSKFCSRSSWSQTHTHTIEDCLVERVAQTTLALCRSVLRSTAESMKFGSISSTFETGPLFVFIDSVIHNMCRFQT